MFSNKYKRKKYWLISISLFLTALTINLFGNIAKSYGLYLISSLSYSFVFILFIIWINTLANRIRDYGSSPWLALFALFPFLNFIVGLYFGIKKEKLLK
ncbi:DUF805 domain-containing protein [Aliarcobacter skirrowii]|uniref:DUF805 domain-containing protein n=1 Tax=Aliarcobacter skirrowii TaxID=28200 RepID=UPI0029A53FF9|nr:DUF805 domain-containing protein [Aliarcobacter skirrowii]MDX4026068.1 DUF805 domain-containing protein [Aliarcobacter skirrowii]